MNRDLASTALLDRIAYSRPNQLRSVWRILFFAAAVFVAGAVVMPIVATVIPRVAMPWMRPTLDCAGVLLATWWLTHAVERGGWSLAGFGRSAWAPRGLLAGAIAGSLAISLPTLLLISAGDLRFVDEPLVDVGRTVAISFAVLAPAALTEELLMRGYAFTVLQGVWGWPAATAATSIVFGVLHLGNPGVTPLAIANVMAAGVFLASVRLLTGSLAAAWAAHFAWNWTMSAGFHSAVSGLPFGTPGYQLVDSGPDWRSGGAWGPEGGVFAAVGMIGAFAGLSWATGRTRFAPTTAGAPFALSSHDSSHAGGPRDRQEHGA
jgi:uncharacterized protein